ncbi:MAG: SH3 domain-containing protein [Chloroflexota bacterium]
MSNGRVLIRFRRVGLVSVIVAIALLVSPVLGVSAQWPPVLLAPIQAASGAVLGTATFTPAASGGVTIQVQVRGFDPIGGSHRLAIANVGNCCPPYLTCAGSEVLVLPDMQFMPDGSANYATTASVNLDWLMRGYGAAIVIHADTNAASAVIGCGVIAAGGAPGMWPPPWGGPPPKPPMGWGWYGPHPGPQPWPGPAPIIGRYRVVAAAGLRLRAGPGTWYAIRRIVPNGTILQATGAEQWGSGMQWAKISYNGVYYWAAKQYLQAY